MEPRDMPESAKGSATIEVYGLGYIGLPLAVRLASAGWKVRGIDTSAGRLARLAAGELLGSEAGLKRDYKRAREAGRLDLGGKGRAGGPAKVGFVCVPTPAAEGARSDGFVRSAAGEFLGTAGRGDVLILESSLEVGTTEGIRDLAESRGHSVGDGLGLCYCPERIDPANKEWGIENIPRVIYCSDDRSFRIAKEVYADVNGGNLARVASPRTAEVVKSFENAFRLVNISLANELAVLCDRLGISAADVIGAASTKPFGFMPHYPGAGAGGHCIPKDPRFLLRSAEKAGAEFATIKHALRINSAMPGYVAAAVDAVLGERGLERTAIVSGLSYKRNIEDMRDSAGFKVAAALASRGIRALGHDPHFDPAHEEKYLAENGLERLGFEVLDGLDDGNLEGISCVCIVQHHDATRDRIAEIYRESKVPVIYDCQRLMAEDPRSKTLLVSLG